MTAREAILTRIRKANGGSTGDRQGDHARIRREYRITSSLSRPILVDLLAARLEHYQVGVRRTTEAGLADAIAQSLATRGARRIVIPRAVPGRWLTPGLEYTVDEGVSYETLDRADGVLTGCTLAIALTGTIILRHGPSEGRRASTLIPDYHLCVVRSDQIVETVPEAFRRISADGPRLLTTISGPSATADIEMTRVRGVHGPRTLEVLLVDEDARSARL
jgi:L-lactate dehydrogenase complex protein LldG